MKNYQNLNYNVILIDHDYYDIIWYHNFMNPEISYNTYCFDAQHLAEEFLQEINKNLEEIMKLLKRKMICMTTDRAKIEQFFCGKFCHLRQNLKFFLRQILRKFDFTRLSKTIYTVVLNTICSEYICREKLFNLNNSANSNNPKQKDYFLSLSAQESI